MDIQASKIKLVKMILNIENQEFIQKLTEFIGNEKEGFWKNLSIEEQTEIKEGLAELKKGQRVSFQEVLKKIS